MEMEDFAHLLPASVVMKIAATVPPKCGLFKTEWPGNTHPMERQNCSPIAVLGGSLEKPKPILSIDKVRRKGPDGMGLLPLLRMPNFFSLMLLNLKMLKMLPAVVDASAAIIDLSFEVPSSGCPILVVRWEYKQVSKLAELAAFPATKYPYFFHLQFSKRFRGCVTAVRTLFLIRYGCRKVKIGSVPGHGDMLDKEERRLSEPTDLLADTRADSILRSEPWSSNLLKRLDRMTGSYSIPSFPSCASVRLCGRKP
uniref:Uncharacterized protein n=1 Tax=Salix viminalis TaxID=40686 RepID=A0A6N2NI24_SALVM